MSIRTRRVINVILFFLFAILGLTGITMILMKSKKSDISHPPTNIFDYNSETYSTNGINSFDENRSDYDISHSNFGTSSYKCTGTCFCSLEEEREASSTTIQTRMLTYLVTAVSSLTAINLARKHFHKECQEKLADEELSCNNIQSDVESCDPQLILTASSSDDTTDKKKKWTSNLSSKEEEEKLKNLPRRDFICKGHCVKRDIKKDFKFVLEQDTEKKIDIFKKTLFLENLDHIVSQVGELGFNCKLLELEFIKIQSPYFADRPKRDNEKFAEMLFMRNHLHGFCAAKSQKNVVLKNKWGNDFETPVSICIVNNVMGLNPSIRCLLQKE